LPKEAAIDPFFVNYYELRSCLEKLPMHLQRSKRLSNDIPRRIEEETVHSRGGGRKRGEGSKIS